MPTKTHRNKVSEQLSLDLMNHFGSKLLRLMSDTAQTCQAGGLSVNDCVSLLLAPLMKETVKLSMSLGMDVDDFRKFAITAFMHMVEQLKQDMPDDDDE